METWLGYFSYLSVGLKATAFIGATSFILGLVVAFAVGIVRFQQVPVLRHIAFVYVEIFRGTSLLVQLFWIYFTLPLFGITLSPITAALVGLALNNGAYGSEIVRGALSSVSRHQFEAATALNFSAGRALRTIILPQALPEMVPPFGNLAILLLKDTALVSMISIADVAFRAQHLRALTQDSTNVYLVTLLIYFTLALIVMLVSKVLEFLLRPEVRINGLFLRVLGGARQR